MILLNFKKVSQDAEWLIYVTFKILNYIFTQIYLGGGMGEFLDAHEKITKLYKVTTIIIHTYICYIKKKFVEKGINILIFANLGGGGDINVVIEKTV